ncbi:hypothetical protein [Polynucleobacter sp. UB-Tiil-W10]|uniref:hypothetical protein n=1 Tax=Polynucleobacter sp. UB-Tiil-W10 TaxID=1855648 RepID=UPI001C0C7446|nr:hypothetical protein [Polynucleobacter sp. UB-Tiil-W10]MBU3540831.1 hypothetical protein [Polynucleobacter sp. UB-Tiil-W10]
MNEELLSMITGLFVGLGAVVLIAGVIRLRRDLAPVAIFAVCIALSELVTLAIGATWLDRFYVWPATAMVCFIGIVNFFLFGAVYKSVSLQILGLLNTQPGGRADKKLLVDVIAQPCVEQRMELLVEMGQVNKSAEQTYAPTLQGLKAVSHLHKLQRLLGIYKSGLYGKT